MAKTGQEIIEGWVTEALKKGYAFRDVRRLLVEAGFDHKQVIGILSVFERLKGKVKPDQRKTSSEINITPRLISAASQERGPVQKIITIPKITEDKTKTLIQVETKKESFTKVTSPTTYAHPKITIPSPKGEAVDTYPLELDKAKIDVRIERTKDGLMYDLYIPEIDIGTRALLDEIRKELIAVAAIAVGEMADQKAVRHMKDRFMLESGKMLEEKVPGIIKETKEFLIGVLMQEMLGLGKIEFLINDPKLEEIVIANSNEVRVYHKNFGWLLTNITLKSEDEVTNYANIIARRVGRQISILTPLLDAHVVTGDRANAVLYPISTKGNTITIRKFSRDPWTIIDLIQNKTISKDIAALLWLAIEYEMNILFSGGTASGKTVCLNACMPFIPPNHRVISMEDTRELMLPKFLYWCPLVTRTANVENKGEVSMLDLLVNSLRMRPDRIVLGEIRRQKEAEVLFEAMHTGHSVYSTVHADTASETIRRLVNPPINIPPPMLNSVNLNVVMFRDRKRGIRRAFQVAEFIPGKEIHTANLLYRWIPERDEFTAHNKSLAFFDTLSRNTGMDEKEINEDLRKKKAIFDWLIKNNIRDLNSFGKLLNLYYTDRERMYSIIQNNRVEEIIEKREMF
jgi:flagellar protein FlaI